MKRRSEPEPPKLLLVEGLDDKHVVEHLCRKLVPDLAPDRDFRCQDTRGIDPLLKAISPALRPFERTALGIVVDANDNPVTRWRAIGHRLRGADVQLPDQPAQGGTIINGEPRVGVWLMPNNSTPGELEHFVAKLVPEGDPVWPLAERYINGIPSEHRQFSTGKELRAKLHAWLATRQEPRKMGAAIRTAELNAEAPIAGQFADWLHTLFGAPPRREG